MSSVKSRNKEASGPALILADPVTNLAVSSSHHKIKRPTAILASQFEALKPIG
jgi:hypothetical protein